MNGKARSESQNQRGGDGETVETKERKFISAFLVLSLFYVYVERKEYYYFL